uniref:Beta-galactoside alpha-2,6-sialyltransferase 2 n=1 Tax=Paramormyrops kingsleyae TaxID=1676925 RepID=A0A3B3SLI6_9TELE|nr:beta-galactoside alpha-2,6-sialyltransferase 2-like [Paramormyrops kingsleyae]
MKSTMKSTMKQWKQLVVAGIVAWILLVLVLFTYFMDSWMDSLQFSTSYQDTMHFTYIQRHKAVMVTPVEMAIAGQGADLRHGPYKKPRAVEKGDSHIVVEEKDFWKRSRDTQIKSFRKVVQEKDQKRVGEADARARNSKTKSLIHRLWKGNMSSRMLSKRLQIAMREYVNMNKHHVVYRGHRWTKMGRQELLCRLKSQLQVLTLDGRELPFSQLGWEKLVPGQPLSQLFESKVQTCAVVSSAGAILNSSLGKEIDDHDVVLRFNAAPTKGYENDVGNRTTIRIINSQILANPSFRFQTSSLYKGLVLVAWDPAPYSVDLLKWYRKPDYDLFTPYVRHRKHHPGQPFYILHPKFIWQLWDVIQGNSLEDIQPNPPSSGFIGILLMMVLCREVHVYEYIPSRRQSYLCHYYEQYYDEACTLGAYHPLLFEKMLVQRLNFGLERDLDRKGKVTLPGFSTVDCSP